MSDSIARANGSGQSPSDAAEVASSSTTVDGDLAVLRQVVIDLGWTLDAIASAMGRDESYKSHISRVLNGERPMSLEFLKALPDDIEIEWHARLAEQGGRVVVAPCTGDDAVRNLVSGLIGVLAAPRLPVRAASMAKAVIAPSRRKVAI